ncbi:DJ-1/PfpI family protein [Micrococcus luteus]|uniref:DJ-1/PfpI family protein n=1 Tax=Micrococcus luteus TaxID=1270 RepID=UPI0036CB9ED6
MCRRSHLDVLPSVRTDLRDAGADVVDQDVAVDGNPITSNSPDDLPVFRDTLVT